MPHIYIQQKRGDVNMVMIPCDGNEEINEMGTKLHGIFWLKSRGNAISQTNFQSFMQNRNENVTNDWINIAKKVKESFNEGHDSVTIYMKEEGTIGSSVLLNSKHFMEQIPIGCYNGNDGETKI